MMLLAVFLKQDKGNMARQVRASDVGKHVHGFAVINGLQGITNPLCLGTIINDQGLPALMA